jgi:hypothetical protein
MSWLITGSQPVPVDPVFNNVSLLLHGNGTNGSTTITDNSPSAKDSHRCWQCSDQYCAQSKYRWRLSIAFDGPHHQRHRPLHRQLHPTHRTVPRHLSLCPVVAVSRRRNVSPKPPFP